MGGACSTIVKKKKKDVCSLLVGKAEGRRPLVRPKRMSMDNIKIDLLVKGWGVVDSIGLASDRNKWRLL
jgi:hypothetical protein